MALLGSLICWPIPLGVTSLQTLQPWIRKREHRDMMWLAKSVWLTLAYHIFKTHTCMSVPMYACINITHHFSLTWTSWSHLAVPHPLHLEPCLCRINTSWLQYKWKNACQEKRMAEQINTWMNTFISDSPGRSAPGNRAWFLCLFFIT